MNNMSLGEVIREHRKKVNKSQDCIAKEAGISRSHLIALEADQYNPSIKTILKLSRALNMDLKILNDYVWNTIQKEAM